MKILVFEYICGGGLAGQALPASLLAEGSMMLQALVAELKGLPEVDLLVVLDERCVDLVLPAELEIAWLDSQKSVLKQLLDLMAACDAVWPIAPETAGILAYIAGMVRSQGKILLLSAPETVALCGDKWATYQHLSAAGLPVVASCLLNDFQSGGTGPWVLKPRDGISCQGGQLVHELPALQELAVAAAEPEQWLVQPYCAGQAISLSGLFKHGKAWLLCCNQQQVAVVDNHFVLRACVVNVANPRRDFYQGLLEKIAAAIPGLWGYIGIDLLETQANGPLLLEINPRLTTSYVGIREATGINVAEHVLALIAAEPVLQTSWKREITIQII